MLLAETSEALSIGSLVIGLGTLITALGGLGYNFVMRREYVAHRESTQEKIAEHDRRIVELENQDSPTGEDYVLHARRNADAHTEIDRRVTREINAVRGDLVPIGKQVTALETETHWQSRLLKAVAAKLDIKIQ